jgi:nucleoside-diphosphate-sugar epimerase
VSASSARVRSGRSASAPRPVIAVTGAASPTGRGILAGLARWRADAAPGTLLAIDADGPGADGAGADGPGADGAGADGPRADGVPAGVRWVTADPSAPGVRAALEGAQVVVHVAHTADQAGDPRTAATARRARVVRSVQEVAGAAAAVGARRLVVVTSAVVYGAGVHGPDPIADDAPLAAERDEGVVGDLLEVERIVARLPRVHPRLRTTVLRPAALVGPGIDTIFTRHLRASRLLALRGEQMRWQFCHVDDLADAVAIAIDQDLDGALAAGALPWLTDGELVRLTGMRRVELPARLAHATAERLRRTGTMTTSAADLSFVVRPWVVGSERLRAAGWQPRHAAADCVREVREPLDNLAPVAGAPGISAQGTGGAAVGAGVRRVEGRDAALGAAGAAVAILGTAALLRQARARRTGRHRPRL